MFLLKCSDLVVFHSLASHIFLLQGLSKHVVGSLLFIVELIKLNLNKMNCTFFCTSRLFLSAKIRISPSLIDWCLYSYISLVFWRSSISRSSPFSRFMKAFASCWACPCIKNIRL